MLFRSGFAVAAQALSQAEPAGHAVGAGERPDECQQAVRHDRRASGPLPGLPRELVGQGGAAYLRCPFPELLVEEGFVKKLLPTCLVLKSGTAAAFTIPGR